METGIDYELTRRCSHLRLHRLMLCTLSQDLNHKGGNQSHGEDANLAFVNFSPRMYRVGGGYKILSLEQREKNILDQHMLLTANISREQFTVYLCH